MYKARSIRDLQKFSFICDYLMPWTVHVFGKRWFFMKCFNLVHASTWKIPHYLTGFLSICTRHETFGIFNIFLYLRLPYAQLGTFFGKRWIFNCILQVGACPNLKDSLIYDFFLFICTRHRKFGIFNFYALSATPYCFARYIILEKDDFSWNISSWCMPQLERFIVIWQVFYPYVQGKKHSVSSIIFLYLRLSYALYGTFFLEKDEFSWNISSWCMPQLERFLNIWIFFYSFVQDIESSVFSTFCAICDSLLLCKVHRLWKRWFFVIKYSKLVHAPNWKIPLYMKGILFICTRQEAICIFNSFPLSATLLCLVRYITLEKRWFFMKYF